VEGDAVLERRIAASAALIMAAGSLSAPVLAHADTSASATTSTGYYFNPTAPTRVLDTRQPIGVPTIAKVPAGGTVQLQLAGTNGIPADATAVALNVTETDATGDGYVAVYPDGTTAPGTSTLNFSAGQVVPNVAVVKLGADGAVELKNSSTGSIDLAADLEGYYATDGDGYVPDAQTRLLDTRSANETVPADGTVRVNLGSAAGSAAAVLNVTATNPTAGGYLTAYPDGTDAPIASNVNFTAKQTVAGETVVEAGSDGYVDFKNVSAGSVDILVDLDGSFQQGTGAAFYPIDPTRVLDTRNGTGTLVVGQQITPPALAAFGTGRLPINHEVGGPVPADAVAIASNLTAAGPAAAGYLTAWNADDAQPGVSTLNFAAGQTVANAATIPLGENGTGGAMLYNGSGGATPVVVDVFGYYA
jgi:hypothetical protein